jgi:hypothetical protein
MLSNAGRLVFISVNFLETSDSAQRRSNRIKPQRQYERDAPFANEYSRLTLPRFRCRRRLKLHSSPGQALPPFQLLHK